MSPLIECRLERVLHLLGLFETGLRYNAAGLAMELGVSRRTVFRDIQLLRRVGVQVGYSEQRQLYFLESSIPRRGLSLSEHEAAILLLGARLSSLHRDENLSRELQDAMNKLLRCLPGSTRATVADFLNTCDKATPTVCVPRNSEPIGEILRAVLQRNPVRIEFQAASSSPWERTRLNLQRVAFTEEGWIVAGRSSLHRSQKEFLVRTIRRVEILDEQGATPEIPPPQK